jgi:hypothetical protein
MKNRKFLSLWVLVFVGSFLFILGCGKQSESGQIRRAQLVGNENLQLKKDIADKDRQIAELKKEVEKAQQENAAIQEQHGDIYKKLLDIIAECQGNLEKYEAQAAGDQPSEAGNQ